MDFKLIEPSKNWNPEFEHNFRDSFEIIETNFPTWTEELESNIREIKTTMQNNLLNLDNRLNIDVPQNKREEMAEQINLLLEEIEIYLSQNYPAQKF